MKEYTAAELRAKFDAGLVLVGQDEDGDLEFCGTNAKWARAEILEEYYLSGNQYRWGGPDDAYDIADNR